MSSDRLGGKPTAVSTNDPQTAQPDETLSPARQIERLEEGLDRGCITEAQFQVLKKQILDEAFK